MDEPKVYYDVRYTQLSIARLTGMVKINGHTYIYEPKTDALVWDKHMKTYLKEQKSIDPTNLYENEGRN